MKIPYRTHANEALARAKEILKTAQGEQLRYAALEIRIALEALSYDKIHQLKGSFPPDQFGRWQPHQVMKILLQIDPTIDQDRSINVNANENGETRGSFKADEHVLQLKFLKKHYAALGSCLHMPTVAQLASAHVIDFDKVRRRCEAAIEELEEILSSAAWNIHFTNKTSFPCSRCSQTVVRDIKKLEGDHFISCWNCNAQYAVSFTETGEVKFAPFQISYVCPNEACGSEFWFWCDDLDVGKTWQCDDCKSKWVFQFGLVEDIGQPLHSPVTTPIESYVMVPRKT